MRRKKKEYCSRDDWEDEDRDFSFKPCPFCGSHTIDVVQKERNSGFVVFIKCSLCGAQTRGAFTFEDVEEAGYETNDVAILRSAWNSRKRGTQ